MVLISTENQAIKNILQYDSYVSGNDDLLESLAKNRAWYGYKSGGVWRFGSSKIIGYKDLSPEKYVERRYELDGRKTEVVLQKWFAEIDEDFSEYEEIWEALTEYLASYGKVPSALARINVLKCDLDDEQADGQEAMLALIVGASRTLDAKHLAVLKKKIAALQ